MINNPIKIIGIGGSLRSNSSTYKILQKALEDAKLQGSTIELIDLRSMKLPFCIGEASDYGDFPDVAKLREAVQSAHGIIFASPEYHGSISGILKNALDLLEIKHMQGKICAIIGVLGGTISQGVNHSVAQVCQELHAWVVPWDLIIPNAYAAIDQQGNFHSKDLERRLAQLVAALVKAAQTHKSLL